MLDVELLLIDVKFYKTTLKRVWLYLVNLIVYIFYNQTFPLLSIFPTKIDPFVAHYIYVTIHSRSIYYKLNWKEPRYLSNKECISNLYIIYKEDECTIGSNTD
jgi:hypothetical protein